MSTDTLPVTNDQIDTWLLDRILREKKEYPRDRITNLGLGAALLSKFRERLPRTDSKHWKKIPELHNAQELANRSCQRLRKAGKLTFTSKEKWLPTNL